MFQYSSSNKPVLQTKFKKTASKRTHGLSLLPLHLETELKSHWKKKRWGKILSVFSDKKALENFLATFLVECAKPWKKVIIGGRKKSNGRRINGKMLFFKQMKYVTCLNHTALYLQFGKSFSCLWYTWNKRSQARQHIYKDTLKFQPVRS